MTAFLAATAPHVLSSASHAHLDDKSSFSESLCSLEVLRRRQALEAQAFKDNDHDHVQ
jgi:hypothetical protein